jgi:uncharacterized iron-regulated protein
MILVRVIAATMMAVGLAYASASAAAAPPHGVPWTTTLHADHLLVGLVWSRRAGAIVAAEDLAAALLAADYALLGEVHDNPDHHRLQAWLVDTIAGASPDRRPPVVFEMIGGDRDEALAALGSRPPGVRSPITADDIAAASDWASSGWPDFALYRSIVETALAHGLPITVGGQHRDVLRRVREQGLSALNGTALEESLREPLPETLAGALEDELFDSHCGLIPRTAMPRMALLQRVTDETMAARLAQQPDAGGILIAGNGHVRLDRGVPWYLRARGFPPTAVASVMLIEVEPGKTDPATYIPRDPDGNPAADFVVFTPRAARPDPCAELRQQFDRFSRPPP